MVSSSKNKPNTDSLLLKVGIIVYCLGNDAENEKGLTGFYLLMLMQLLLTLFNLFIYYSCL